MDLNELHTQMHAAVAAQDFQAASELRDRISAATGGSPPGSWELLGLPAWLADRARQLGFEMPTATQAHGIPAILSGQDACIAAQTGSGKTLAFLLPALAAIEGPPKVYADDLKGPQVVIMVPTRDLGVQISLLAYRMLGGSLNGGHAPGKGGNMFQYGGPRGIEVRGLLLPEEVLAAVGDRYLRGVHAVVGTPDLIALAMQGGVEVTQHAKVIVIDEADACAQIFPGVLDDIMGAATSPTPDHRPAVVLVGASLAASPTPLHFRDREWLASEAVEDLLTHQAALAMPPSLRHRVIVVEREEEVLATLCRQLRAEHDMTGPDAPPPRVIVFAASESGAVALAAPLRRVLWGSARLSVLLPGGVDALRTLAAFRDGSASLLLTTPAAARGLDLPAVQAVYCLGPPADPPAYAHAAGRLGRIGAAPGARGTVTSLVTPGEQAARLEAVASLLGVELERVQAPPPVPLDPGAGLQELRKGMDDLFSMY